MIHNLDDYLLKGQIDGIIGKPLNDFVRQVRWLTWGEDDWFIIFLVFFLKPFNVLLKILDYYFRISFPERFSSIILRKTPEGHNLKLRFMCNDVQLS